MSKAGGLRGFVGQRMALKNPQSRIRGCVEKLTPGATSFTSPAFSTMAEVWLWGGGGTDGGGGGAGGGGAEGVWVRFRCAPSTVLSGVIGAKGSASDGGDTTFTLPSGQVVTARGGKVAVVGTPGLGGGVSIATGVNEIHRRGGDGGAPGNGGQSGDHGGLGGGSTGSLITGGGGAGGFTDIGDFMTGGKGATDSSPAAQYGGGGAPNGSAAGDGRIAAIFTRIAA